jgi:hypothetical protein
MYILRIKRWMQPGDAIMSDKEEIRKVENKYENKTGI